MLEYHNIASEGDNIAQIIVGQNESLESALKRFKKKIENEGITKEFKDRQYFVKPSQIRHEHDRSIQHRQKRKRLLSQRKGLHKGKKRDRREKREKRETAQERLSLEAR